ncbi:glycosyltransferase [Halpernia frigidisoli]|uniref:Glycosyltransferase involved in cell wall bisynthesis n=1 Tax=Halpernia frigidisoli TaxID=1125876 RepID=A0A1I3D0T9_9FLAO|nr:glycosyltransferase [Halpernia frigidisoli]SFH80332.1 Glycosyltransferase involved in cell wall bisynthesis [Halpernia frigidisoli]
MNDLKIIDNADYDIIVFCHLRWDFVYQRPQHILSRLSKDYRILVVEEPVHAHDGFSTPKIIEINPHLHVLKPEVSNIEEIGIFLKKLLNHKNFPIAWFYSAAFVQVLDILDFEIVIYDCMDELTLFKGASEKLIEQENYLLSAVDVVFTGGKSLYESKKLKHSNVHCFPSSVDVAHFANINFSDTINSHDLQDIPKPIVGYYGVIDERIDLDLIEMTAMKMPDVSFVMIGPICKIEESDLPKNDNIYYLGMKSYEELPVYLKSFDFAMMPFALNDSTKFISPTKTLEYMCAHKPIISTKIKDVVRDYSDCINIIESDDDFVASIKNPKQNFESRYDEILENTSWDKTVQEMKSQITNIK